MGKVEHIFYEKLITESPDRAANYLKVYRAPNDEVTIWFRNLKIVLHTKDEIEEWQRGFAEALENFKKGDYFKNDIQ